MDKWQEERKTLMRLIAQEITASTKDALVLKGGTSLLLAYALDRFSVDMDYDAKYPVDLEKHIERAVGKCGIEIKAINLSKDTNTTKRYKIHYEEHNTSRPPFPLKLECSFRQALTIDEADVIEIDEIRVYRINKLAEQKVGAFLSRERARDIYDIHFLLRKHPDAFNNSILKQLVDEIDRKGIDMILKAYEDDSEADDVLSNTDGMTIVLELEQLAHSLRDRLQEGTK